jgi:hypothetical protein
MRDTTIDLQPSALRPVSNGLRQINGAAAVARRSLAAAAFSLQSPFRRSSFDYSPS